jgi:hypothetical protein
VKTKVIIVIAALCATNTFSMQYKLSPKSDDARGDTVDRYLYVGGKLVERKVATPELPLSPLEFQYANSNSARLPIVFAGNHWRTNSKSPRKRSQSPKKKPNTTTRHSAFERAER